MQVLTKAGQKIHASLSTRFSMNVRRQKKRLRFRIRSLESTLSVPEVPGAGRNELEDQALPACGGRDGGGLDAGPAPGDCEDCCAGPGI